MRAGRRPLSSGLARELGESWRVIALDQRGHRYSDRPSAFSRIGYIEDAATVLEHLGIDGAVVLGHSLGGVNAYQLAARHPGLVGALITEDIGAEVDGDLSFSLSWPHRAPNRNQLLAELGPSATVVPHQATFALVATSRSGLSAACTGSGSMTRG